MEATVGVRPWGCPWRARTDPLALDVARLYSVREARLHEPLVGGWDEAPRRIVEALAVYDRAFRAALSEVREQERLAREQEQKRPQGRR